MQLAVPMQSIKPKTPVSRQLMRNTSQDKQLQPVRTMLRKPLMKKLIKSSRQLIKIQH